MAMGFHVAQRAPMVSSSPGPHTRAHLLPIRKLWWKVMEGFLGEDSFSSLCSPHPCPYHHNNFPNNPPHPRPSTIKTTTLALLFVKHSSRCTFLHP